jgi:tetratricopeptide (TPR) repeat protein
MASHPSPYRSRLYRDFFAIDPEDYQRIIRFFEEKEAEIGRLEGDEHFDLLLAYTDALFAVGDYRRHLLMVDFVIESVFQSSPAPVRSSAIFQRLLFRKAASCFHVRRYAQAEHVLRELLRINPDLGAARTFLRKVLRMRQPKAYQLSRALGVGLLAMGGAFFCLELLLIRPFYALQVGKAIWLRNGFFIAGIASFVLGIAWVYARAYLQTRLFMDGQKKRKSARR